MSYNFFFINTCTIHFTYYYARFVYNVSMSFGRKIGFPMRLVIYKIILITFSEWAKEGDTWEYRWNDESKSCDTTQHDFATAICHQSSLSSSLVQASVSSPYLSTQHGLLVDQWRSISERATTKMKKERGKERERSRNRKQNQEFDAITFCRKRRN